MFALLENWRRCRVYRQRAWPSAAALELLKTPPPSTPPGWQIVPHTTPGVTAYEVLSIVPPLHSQQPRLPDGLGSIDMVGLNASEFYGFPPETLEIGRVDLRFMSAGGLRLTYRFHFNPAGWRRPCSLIPSFDFHRLPLGTEEPADANA